MTNIIFSKFQPQNNTSLLTFLLPGPNSSFKLGKSLVVAELWNLHLQGVKGDNWGNFNQKIRYEGKLFNVIFRNSFYEYLI